MIENTYYTIELGLDIKADLFNKNEVILTKGEKLKLSYDQFRTLCSNSYVYISINIQQGVNISVKVHLDDINAVTKYVTKSNILHKPFNPEEEFPD